MPKPSARSVGPRIATFIRLEQVIGEAVRQWAIEDCRSTNGQIEYLLKQALQNAGRLAGDQ